MRIDLAAPACLVLGLVRFEDKTAPCLLGVALQHPPFNIAAVPSAGLMVSGPRAEAALRYLQQAQAALGITGGLEAEIDYAIPIHMGLGSDAMLGLSMARALAWANDRRPVSTAVLARALGLGAAHGLDSWAFDRGGLLLVDTLAGPDGLPAIRRRAEIAHEDKQAWAFHLVLPHAPDDAPEMFEEDRLQALLAAGEYLSPETGRIVDAELWPALERDDIAAFGAAVMALQRLNEEALSKVGAAQPPTDLERQVFAAMQEMQAVAWGRMATGLGLFGMVRGRAQTQAMRIKLVHTIGYEGGTAMATIADNAGARHEVKPEGLDSGEIDWRVNVGQGRGAG